MQSLWAKVSLLKRRYEFSSDLLRSLLKDLMDLRMICKVVQRIQIPDGGYITIVVTITTMLLLSKLFLT